MTEQRVRYEVGQNSNGVAACLVQADDGSEYDNWRCSLDKYHNGDHAAHHLHDLREEIRVSWPNKQYIITELEIPSEYSGP